MVALLVRLKAIQLWRDFTRSTRRVVASLLGFGYLAAVVFGATSLLVSARQEQRDILGPLTVVAGASLTLLWAIGPLLATGIDQTLDPARFATFPVPARRLLPGLLVASLLEPGSIASAVVAGGYVYAYSYDFGTTLIALLAAVVGLVTALLASRTLSSAFGDAFASRRWRDGAAVALTVLAMATALGALLLNRAMALPHSISRTLEATAAVAGWTPVGWAWAVPASFAAGDVLGALARLLLALVLLAGLLAAWGFYVERGLTSPLGGGAAGGRVRGSSWVDRLFGSSPVGAVAARCLRYWRRDPRHLTTAVSMLLLPVMVAGSAEYGGVTDVSRDLLRLLIPAVVGLVAGPSVAMDVSFDGSALWAHISSGLRGVEDRWGRLLAFLVLLVPVVGAASVIAMLLVPSGAWSVMFALAAATTLSSLGMGSLAGSYWQVPVPPPGQNAFGRTSGGGAMNLLTTFGTLTGTLVACLPAFVAVVFALVFPGISGWVLLGCVGWGGLVLVGGVWLGGRRLDRRWPEVLRSVTYERA